jgi:hypothetical protein
MSQIMCNAGETQIEKILKHAQRETKLLRVSAVVFVGDAMEENPDTLAYEANELGRLGVPAFVFQEGHDRDAEQTFRDMARLTHGAYCHFDPGANLAEHFRLQVARGIPGWLPASSDIEAKNQAPAAGGGARRTVPDLGKEGVDLRARWGA